MTKLLVAKTLLILLALTILVAGCTGNPNDQSIR